MAIARDVITNGVFPSAGNTTSTWNHTCTGSNLILWIVVLLQNSGSGGTSNPTGFTYNGASLTLAVTHSDANGNRSQLWYLIGPATGTHAVICTFGSAPPSAVGGIVSVSYTGARQTGQPDAISGNDNTTGTGVSTNLTTVANNTWIIAMAGSPQGSSVIIPGGYTAWPGYTSSTTFLPGDSNGFVSPAGTSSLGASWGQTIDGSIVAVSFAALEFTGAITLTIGNAASRTMSIKKAMMPSAVSLTLMNGASRLATVARNKAYTLSLSMMNFAGRLITVSKIGGVWQNVAKSLSTFTNQPKS